MGFNTIELKSNFMTLSCFKAINYFYNACTIYNINYSLFFYLCKLNTVSYDL